MPQGWCPYERETADPVSASLLRGRATGGHSQKAASLRQQARLRRKPSSPAPDLGLLASGTEKTQL